MKRIKKLASLMLAVVMVLAMGITASAATKEVDSGKNGEGSITIQNANPDQTYGFWRIFSATPNAAGTNASYKLLKTAPAEGDAFYTYFDVDAAGNVSITDDGKDSTNPNELSAAAVNYLNDNYSSIGEFVYNAELQHDGLEGDDKTYELIVKGLQYGYYYITTTTGTVVSVDTVKPNAETREKNPGTTIDKKVTGVADGSIDEAGKNALAQVGTTVRYETRIPIANGARNYLFTDTMTDGLTLNANDVKVYLVDKNTEVAEGAAEETDYGTLSAENKTGDTPDITIEFSQTWLTNNVGKEIVIQYSAVLNKDAVISGSEGNPNTATISWGNTSDYLHDEDNANVFSAEIVVNKIDDEQQPLAGAGFILKNSAGKYYKNTDGIVSWVEEGEATEYITEVKNVSENGETVQKAVVTFSGLADGEYTLIEKTVPAGYNKAEDKTITISEKDVTVSNTSKPIDVTNNKGSLLPSTGGIGTTIFYVVGSILVIGAGILLVAKKRMGANK